MCSPKCHNFAHIFRHFFKQQSYDLLHDMRRKSWRGTLIALIHIKLNNPKILALNVELELKAEKDSAEIRLDNPEDF